MDIDRIANEIVDMYTYDKSKPIDINVKNAATRFHNRTTKAYRRSISPAQPNIIRLLQYLSVIQYDKKSPLYIAIEERLLLKRMDELL